MMQYTDFDASFICCAAKEELVWSYGEDFWHIQPSWVEALQEEISSSMASTQLRWMHFDVLGHLCQCILIEYEIAMQFVA